MSRESATFVEKDLTFPFSTPPAPATLMEVARGVHWLRMPLPLALDHINLWLLEDGEGWTLIDTGFGDEETCRLWRRVLAGEAAGREPTRLICTHYHPDHFGLAGWHQRVHDLPVWMTEKEWIVGTLLSRLDDVVFSEGQDAFFARHGVAPDLRAWFRRRGNNYRKRVQSPPDGFTRIRDGEEIPIGGRRWQVLVGEGHAAEHACLYCAELGVLIAGDQILPEITPNISVHWFKSGSRPLADYLTSLRRIAELPDETLVLPSHKMPFRGLRTRVDALRWHHMARLSELQAALLDGVPRTAAELLPALFHHRLLRADREGNHYHLMFAIGEVVAHLVHLVDAEGLVEQRRADGSTVFRAP